MTINKFSYYLYFHQSKQHLFQTIMFSKNSYY
nr:MAG TPA: hypothetical protein [Crassvirales sp.]